MSASRPTERSSRLAYGLLALTFVALAVFAVERTLRLEAQMADEQRQRAEAELRQVLQRWEDAWLERVRGAVRTLARAPLSGAQNPPPYVDAVFLWRQGNGEGGEMLWPEPHAHEDIEALLTDPCMVQAAATATADANRVVIAQAWLSCADQAPPVAMLAASRAADQFLAAGRPADARAALDTVDLPLHPSADVVRALALSPDRVLTRQLQAAEASRQLGNDTDAIAALVRAGQDIVGRQGDALDRSLPLLTYPVLADLRAMGATAEADRLEQEAQPVKRYLAAWRQVTRLAAEGQRPTGPVLLRAPLPQPAAGTDDNDAAPSSVRVSVVADPFGERRFLLAIAQLPDGLVLALQLDPARMLAELDGSGTPGTFFLLDAAGAPLSGQLPPHGDTRAMIPLTRLFPELRLALVETEPSKSGGGWRTSQLAPLGLVFMLAGFAIWARIRADRQLRELWERQQAFVNRVSHELKTPLAGVKVMAELIDMGIVTEPAEIRQNVQRIITEVCRMEDRVNEVLRLARRPEVTSREVIDVRGIAESLAEVWEPRFEQRGARLMTQLEDTDPVEGDRPLLHDAMNNLLDNALKYLSEERPGIVRVRTATSGRWVVFEVTDNGIGVPEEMRKAIFERFARVEGDDRGMAGGHGLGLAFVAEAVGSHGGKVECRDGIAGGARFVIRLRRSR